MFLVQIRWLLFPLLISLPLCFPTQVISQDSNQEDLINGIEAIGEVLRQLEEFKATGPGRCRGNGDCKCGDLVYNEKRGLSLLHHYCSAESKCIHGQYYLPFGDSSCSAEANERRADMDRQQAEAKRQADVRQQEREAREAREAAQRGRDEVAPAAAWARGETAYLCHSKVLWFGASRNYLPCEVMVLEDFGSRIRIEVQADCGWSSRYRGKIETIEESQLWFSAQACRDKSY